MATETFVTQFISAVGCKEKKGGVSIANGGINGSPLKYLHSCSPSFPRVATLWLQWKWLTFQHLTPAVSWCSFLQVSKILFFFFFRDS